MIFPEGLRIKQFQEEQGLKGKDIAKLANISPAYYSQITTGKREPTITTVRNIAKVLNVSMAEIFDTLDQQYVRKAFKFIEETLLEKTLYIGELT